MKSQNLNNQAKGMNTCLIRSEQYCCTNIAVSLKNVVIYLFFALLLLLIRPGVILAQTGSVFGEVKDASNQESLPGATILIQGTTIGATTDADGRYTLRRVPVGEQIIEVRYIGFVTKEIPVVIEDSERLELYIELIGELIEGDEILIEAYQRGQARALTRQRESANIRTVISSEQMDRFADQTIDGALSRIPGMGHDGSANIRGIGADMSNVTMDGQRMGTTGAADRSVDLSTISADMVEQLEVIKVITPDMSADALSGVININTRRPIGGDRNVNIRLGGGTNLQFRNLFGANTRNSFSYGDSPRNDFSYGFNLSYQRNTSPSERVATDWRIMNFGEGPVDVISSLRNELRLRPTESYGSGLQLTFQPTARTTFHIQGMFNYYERDQLTHGIRFDPRLENFVSQYETGPVPGYGGRITYNAQLDDNNIHQYTFRAGARHLFDGFDLEYNIGWGHGRSQRDQYLLQFSNYGYDFIIDADDRWNPTFEIAEWGIFSHFPTDSEMSFSHLDHQWFKAVDNEFNGNVDFNIPIGRGLLKFGSSAIMSFKDGYNERFLNEFGQLLNVGQFDHGMGMSDQWNVFGRDHQTYNIPWLVDLYEARNWYYTMYPQFSMDVDLLGMRAATSRYEAQEHVFSVYGMGTVKFGSFTFLGGTRVEQSITRYAGRDGTIDVVGRFRGAEDISSKNSYTHLFPNGQLVFALGRFTNFRLAYSRSIGRPTFSQLNPQILRRYDSESITEGNPDLRPMVSDNYDFLFEHYFINVGHITAGLFYKELEDFVYSFTERLGDEGIDGEGAYSAWQYSSFRNGDEATVYGLELSWQQYLDFLPGILGNLGTYANYSYTHSLSDVGRRDTDGNIIYQRLSGQRPHVVNLGINYNQGGFSTQISYQWATASIAGYGNLQWVPEIQLQERVYFDRYNDARNNLSLTMRYRLTSNFRIWIDADNVMNHRSINYIYDRKYYPSTATSVGTSVNMGIRYSL